MAGYRQIHTQIWKDEWYIELSPEEKLVFVYLFSNELASISGIYKIPERVISNETGVRIEDVRIMLEEFEAAGKIMYGDGVLWVKNMNKFHANASPRTQKKVEADVAMIPECKVKQAYIQYQQGIDIPSIPRSESESESENKNENKNESENESGNENDVAVVFQTYEQEIGPITPAICEELKDAIEHCPRDWILESFVLAAENNVRKWKYAHAILKSWETEGRGDNRQGRDSPPGGGFERKNGGNGSVASNLDKFIQAEGIL